MLFIYIFIYHYFDNYFVLAHQRKNVSSVDVPKRWIKRIQRIDGLSTREQDALALIIDAFLVKPKSKAAS